MTGSRKMPLQNRVTPFGDIIAVTQRGSLMGNRGIIHDPATKTLLKRRWSSRAWIICVCQFKNVRRDVMARRSWTELFFLDEATALSAGHRPCFYCQRQRAKEFQAAWADGNATELPSAPQMDAILHDERLDQKGPQKTLPTQKRSSRPARWNHAGQRSQCFSGQKGGDAALVLGRLFIG